MYILYVDESGDPNSWTDQNHYVLGGLAVHEGQVRHLAEQFSGIQNVYFPEISLPIPFHATEIAAGRGRFRHLMPIKRE